MHELMIIRHLSSDHAHLNYFKSPRQLRHGLSFRKSCRSCRSCQMWNYLAPGPRPWIWLSLFYLRLYKKGARPFWSLIPNLNCDQSNPWRWLSRHGSLLYYCPGIGQCSSSAVWFIFQFRVYLTVIDYWCPFLFNRTQGAGLNTAAVAKGKLYFGSATDNPELTDAPYLAQLSNTDDFGQITPGNAQKVG